VGSIELDINGGKKVVETVLLNLIELLMTQLIKLDGIAADGDVKRVQKYIETLDVLKTKNSGLGKVPMHQQHQIFTMKTFNSQQKQRKQGNFTEMVNAGPVVVTTKWETF
ncbi:BCL-2-associated athanogene 2, partial [Striga asiatica]